MAKSLAKRKTEKQIDKRLHFVHYIKLRFMKITSLS